MSIINLSPEAVELVNQICEPSNLEEKINVLDAAEEQLQKLAYENDNSQDGYNLYDLAYTLKIFNKDLQKLKTLLEDGKDRDS